MSPSIEERLIVIFRQLLQNALPFYFKVIYNIQQFILSTIANNIILE